MSKDPAQLTKQHSEQQCAACTRFKQCYMYVTQMGTSAWVCDDCRKGKK